VVNWGLVISEVRGILLGLQVGFWETQLLSTRIGGWLDMEKPYTWWQKLGRYRKTFYLD
jgi:hypothetical protein